ncbi:hypothetical protein [Paracidovorax cattleyae]|uniref:hypothetical protein n=1 Tax=Paracidovorax cattleyae TaxID=80868 RepID=UPI00115FB6C9|nr:hypothetical protein [Paracidovorax cattleyae]
MILQSLPPTSKSFAENNSFNEKFFKNLTTRSLQALGGLITHQFFKEKGKMTKDTDALVLHQLSILIQDNLLEWENVGATLPINGRGDPVPESFKKIDQELNGLASQVTDYSTEIGLCALYTSDHSESRSFLLQLLSATNLTNRESIDAAILNLLPRGDGWGPTISQEEYTIITRNIA